MKLPVISFFTPSYKPYAERLEKSLREVEPDRLVYICPVPSQGDWVSNCAYKPEFIRREIRELCIDLTYPGVIWLDADAEVKGPLGHLDALVRDGVDFAAMFPVKDQYPRVNSRLLSGTMVFSRNAIGLVNDWLTVQNRFHTSLDQDTLLATLCHWDRSVSMRKQLQTLSPRQYPLEINLGLTSTGQLHIHDMLPEFVCIPDLMPNVSPIVVHHQASRTHRYIKE